MSTAPNLQREGVTIIRQALDKTRKAFGYVLLFSLCMNLVLFALPMYSLQVLDRVISTKSGATLFWLTFITVSLFIFYGMFNAVRAAVLNRIAEWLDREIAPQLLANAIIRSSLSFFTSGSQYHRDLGAIKSFITSGSTSLFDAPWAILFVLVVYMINPVLGFVTLMGCLILLIFAVITEFVTKKPTDLQAKSSIRVNQIADIATRNAEAIEAMGLMGNILKDWKEHNRRTLDLYNLAANRSNILYSTSRVIRMVLQIAITGVGAGLALSNDITVGGMIASSIMAARALSPFEAAIGTWKGWLMAREAYHRLNRSFATHNPEMRGNFDLPAPQGRIQADQLIYRAPGSDKPIIKGVTFQLNPGEALGIIGPSAAGKSTLAKLLIGILPPTHGAVRIDGADIFKWNRELIGPHVGYQPQDVELFSGTIKDNIARMDKNAPDELVIQAAKRAHVHEMILQLPQGYETQYMYGNINLSPGQRQRIGLAMALYGNPRLLVLDEPNSNLDGEGERALLAALHYIRSQKITTVVVAHRPSVVAFVDKIMMLRAGVIEAFGPREEVLAKYAPKPQAAPQQLPPKAAAGA